MGNGWLTMFFFYLGLGVAIFTILYGIWMVLKQLWFYLIVVPLFWFRDLLIRSELI